MITNFKLSDKVRGIRNINSTSLKMKKANEEKERNQQNYEYLSAVNECRRLVTIYMFVYITITTNTNNIKQLFLFIKSDHCNRLFFFLLYFLKEMNGNAFIVYLTSINTIEEHLSK